MTDMQLKCADADEMLLDYFEQTLAGPELARLENHISACARCSALIRDVNEIRGEARSLEDLTPSRDLWAEVEPRIQPHVVPITATRGGRAVSRGWMAAAAAALIVSTAGLTYMATFRTIERRVAATAAPPSEGQGVRSQGLSDAAVAEDPESVVASADETQVARSEAGGTRANRSGGVSPESAGRATGARTATAGRSRLVSGGAPVVSATERAYGQEIRQLQSVLAQRREELDPETVRVVEDNLKLIDAAVRQARAALARDPASGFLADMLNDALVKKVELLRTVALLPSRT